MWGSEKDPDGGRAAAREDPGAKESAEAAGRLAEGLGFLTAARNRLNTRWWGSFFVAFFLVASISISTPPVTGPDEPSQVAKAAATVRGEFFGKLIYDPWRDTVSNSPYVGFKLPNFYQALGLWASCLYFTNNVPASCMGKAPNPGPGTTTVSSYHGRLSPVYYFPVGLVSLFMVSVSGLYLMRIVNDLIVAALLASAFECAYESKKRKLALLSTLLCITPAALVLYSPVGSFTMEDACGVLLTASALRLVTDPESVETRQVVRFTVAASLLPFARGVSPLIEFLILVLVLLAHGRKNELYKLLGRRDLRIGLSVAGLCYLLACAWDLYYKSYIVVGNKVGGEINWGIVFNTVYTHLNYYIYQQIASYQFLFSPAAGILFGLAMGAVLFASLCTSSVRAIACTALAAFCYYWGPLPPILATYRENNIVWLGRYFLPLIGLVLLVPAYGQVPQGRIASRIAKAFEDSLVLSVLWGMVAGAYVIFLYELERMYAVGLRGKAILIGSFPWQPPDSVYGALFLMWGSTLFFTARVVFSGLIGGRREVMAEEKAPVLRELSSPGYVTG